MSALLPLLPVVLTVGSLTFAAPVSAPKHGELLFLEKVQPPSAA
jgi:hypothetical protein